MKKIFTSVLCIVLSVCFSVSAFALSDWTDDFDSYYIGATKVGISFSANTETSIIEVDYDPLDETNKVLKIDHDGESDRYMSRSGDYSKKTTIKFKFYLPESGGLRMYFRDSLGTTNNMYIFSATTDKISAAGQTLNYDNSKWVSIQLSLDMRADSIALYTDIENGYNGMLTLAGKSSFSELFGECYENHTTNSTTLRIGPMKSKAKVYLDDCTIMSNVSLSDNFFARPFSAFKKFSDIYDRVASLRTGNIMFSSEITALSADTDSATLLFALYGADGRMKDLVSSEKQTFSLGETKTVSATMNITSLEKGDYVRTFLLDDTNNIKPLMESYDFTQSELYYRPGTYEVLEDLLENHPTEYDHPRVVRTNEEFDTLRSYLETDSYFKSLFDKVKASANLTPSLPSYTYDARNTILSQSRNAMNAILPLAFLYQMSDTEEDKAAYADAVWRVAGLVCDTEQFPDWNHHHHYLDTGEMALAVAIAYDWCYDYWTDEQLKIMEDALYNNIIEISLGVFEGRYGYSGLKATTNWNPVCNGGTITAAAAIAHKYPTECAKVISYSTEAIEKCLHDYAPSGGYSESPTYWDYGTTYLMWCLSTLDSACGTSYGIEKASGLSITGYFPAYATGPTGNWNYHDGGTGYLNTSLSMFFADKYNDPNLAGMRYNYLNNGIYGKSLSPNFKDLLFYNPELINPDFDANDLDLDSYYQGIETVFMRGSFTDKSTIFTGLHGGYNSTNHGDMDAGTFILDAEGVRFIDELGGDAYTLDGYFGKGDNGKSWKYYRKGTEGQSTIMIADDETIPYGQKGSANIKITDFVSKPSGSYAVADMAPALGAKVTEAKRGVFLSDNRSEVIVQDEISFNAPTELYWLAHTKGSVTVDTDGKRAVIERNGKYMAAYLISDNDSLVFETMDAEPLLSVTYTGEGENSRAAFKKLYIHAKDVNSFNTSVVFRIIDSPDAQKNYNYEYKSISEWSIEE